MRSYVVPAESESAPATTTVAPAAVAPQAEPTHRMFGAMMPVGDQAWFFKLVAPIGEAEKLKEDIEQLWQSIKVDDAGGKAVWETPDGWTARGPDGKMRVDTLLPPGSDEAPEAGLSVIPLPIIGDWNRSALDNLNRWRGQMGLPPAAALNEPSGVVDLKDVADGLVVIDLAGSYGGGMSAAPFAGGGGAPTPRPTPPPTRPEPRSDPPSRPSVDYDLPDGWKELPGTSMRVVNLETTSDADAASVTGFVFPAIAEMASPLANINRWRREIGLPPIEQAELDDASETIKLSGLEGVYAELAGEQESTFAAMAQSGDRVWFFKLRGPTAAVEAQREAFRRWLESLTIEGTPKSDGAEPAEETAPENDEEPQGE